MCTFCGWFKCGVCLQLVVLSSLLLCCGGARGRVGLLPLLLARTECDVGIVLALLQTHTYLSTSSSFGIVDKTPFDFLSSSLCMLSPCVCALGEVGDQIMHEKEEKLTLSDKLNCFGTYYRLLNYVEYFQG